MATDRSASDEARLLARLFAGAIVWLVVAVGVFASAVVLGLSVRVFLVLAGFG